MTHFPRYGVLALAAVLASSCASPPIASSGQAPAAAPSSAPAAAAAPVRHVQSIIECPDAGDVVPKPGASSAPFEQVDKLPTGQAFHLDFKARKAMGNTPEADKIYFEDDTPFDVRFVEGPDFQVIDKDASDGAVVVQVPAGYYDTYLGTTGKPGGSVTVGEPTFFQAQTIASSSGQDSWSHVGLRQLPNTGSYGDYRIHLEPKNVTGISGRWYSVPASDVPTPPIPPLPPQLSQLSAPDQAMPGETVSVTATVTDPNNDITGYAWSTTYPDGHTAADNPVGDATATWTAPFEAGTYLVNLAVDDPYFTTKSCQPLPIVVPNLCPEASVAGDDTAQPGASVTLTGTATDANHDALTWSWTATGGTVSPAAGASTTWTAPTTAGTYTLTGTADDGHGCKVPVSKTITVVAPTPSPSPTPPPNGTPVLVATLPYVADRIGVGPDGNAWVTYPSADKVGQVSKTGKIIGTWDAGGPPVDVAVTPVNHAWFTLSTGYVRYMTAGTGAVRQHLYVGSGLRDICTESASQTAYPAIAGESKVAVLFGTNAVYKWGTVNTPIGIDWSEDNKILVTVRGYGSQYIRKHEPGAFSNGRWLADYATGAGPQDIKVDRVNHRIWVVCEDSNVMTVLNSSGQRVTPDFNWRTPNVYNHTDLAVDHDGNGWLAMGSLMEKFSPTGQLLGTFQAASGVTVDSEGYVWFTSGNKVYRMLP